MPAREGRLAHVLVSMADTLVSDFDVLDLFVELVENSKELFDDVAQAGLLLADGHEGLRVAASTSEVTRVVELLELENQGGPGAETFRSGRPVVTGPLSDPAVIEKWGDIGVVARDFGYSAIAAIPMRLRSEVLGALNLFLVGKPQLPDEDLIAAQALADMATIAILQDRLAVDDQALISQLRTALESRVAIEQAKGVVAQETGLDMDGAFRRIRQHARRTNRRLRDVAEAIVAGDLSPTSIGD